MNEKWKPGLSACTNGSTARSHAVLCTFYRPAMWIILESIISDTISIKEFLYKHAMTGTSHLDVGII